MLPNHNFINISHVPPGALHVLPISSSLIWSSQWYLVKGTNYGALHYTVFSRIPSLHPFPYTQNIFVVCKPKVVLFSIISQSLRAYLEFEMSVFFFFLIC
jgi:hypothetical protein